MGKKGYGITADFITIGILVTISGNLDFMLATIKVDFRRIEKNMLKILHQTLD